MIIKTLKLQNIRSYKEATIDFPIGTTLFEGEIGSGKSTILMAIEFALFGLGEEKGASLLRTGKSEGKVGLIFESNGKEYTILRSLVRKGKSVQQSEGSMETEQGTMYLSPTELKEKVLEVLNFNEPPDPKAQSVIYRYAVFTPQEEMKTILFLRPDLRLQTLRKAFRIEGYKVASENAAQVARTILIKNRELESMTANFEEVKERIGEKQEEIDQNSAQLAESEKEEDRLDGELKAVKKEMSKFQEEKVRLSKVIGKVPLLEKAIQDKNGQIKDENEQAQKHQKKVNELAQKIEKIQEVEKPTDKTEEELQKDIKEMEKEERRLRKVETEIDAKISDYRSIEENKMCPTCDRPARPEVFKHKIEKKVEDKETASLRVEECVKALEEAKELLTKLEVYNEAQGRLKEYQEQLEGNQEEVKKRRARVKELEDQVEDAKKELGAAREELKRLEAISKRIGELEEQMGKVDIALKSVRDQITVAKTTITNLTKDIGEYQKQVKQKEDQRKKATLLKEYHIWLEDFFIPTLGTIEKHVMMNINQDFNQNFQKWFAMLVEDPSKDARIDEDFTPIVEQDGYEQDIYYLSGGEKTSVALAYRLALNSIVQKVSTGMESNLLILDEPTDGFSKEQMSKVRDILDELGCPQVIIVSHEKELESFADQIFRVEKDNGISRIVR
ncbi:MAG: SMC family ATPase [Nitrososphaerales archaeon]|nr:SMC family ATPase [Nitrososphaerales archaeon]